LMIQLGGMVDVSSNPCMLASAAIPDLVHTGRRISGCIARGTLLVFHFPWYLASCMITYPFDCALVEVKLCPVKS